MTVNNVHGKLMNKEKDYYGKDKYKNAILEQKNVFF